MSARGAPRSPAPPPRTNRARRPRIPSRRRPVRPRGSRGQRAPPRGLAIRRRSGERRPPNRRCHQRSSSPFPFGSPRTAPSHRLWPRPCDGSYGDLLDLFGLGQGVRLAPSALHRLVPLPLVAGGDVSEKKRTGPQPTGGVPLPVPPPPLPPPVFPVPPRPAPAARDEGG